MISKECINITKNKIIKLTEKKCSFELHNEFNNELKIIKVDNCAITEGIRCDYMIIIKEYEIFIELKGHDINHAFKQIEESIIKLSKDKERNKKQSYIVCVRSPLQSPLIQKMQKYFKKKYNSELIIKSLICSISI